MSPIRWVLLVSTIVTVSYPVLIIKRFSIYILAPFFSSCTYWWLTNLLSYSLIANDDVIPIAIPIANNYVIVIAIFSSALITVSCDCVIVILTTTNL